MAAVKPGRIVRAEADVSTSAVTVVQGGAARGSIARREVLDAAERAERLLGEARTQANAIIQEAERACAEVRLRAEAEGRADAVAALAARALELASLEQTHDERALERTVELARALAERLLGEALELDPDRVTALARQALGEARGAKQARIAAHPDDAERLARSIEDLGLHPGAVTLEPDPAQARGSLRIETDIGVLDASLGPQLDRLALKLRESLGRKLE